MLLLLVVKAVVWLVALGSGTSGGVLAPLLILGGALGALVGQWLPGGDPGFWALVGMAAMMGGTMRAPLTGALFALELTGDFNALPPLLCGSAAAYAVTRAADEALDPDREDRAPRAAHPARNTASTRWSSCSLVSS